MKELNQERLYQKIVGRQGRGKTHGYEAVPAEEGYNIYDNITDNDWDLGDILAQGNTTGQAHSKLPSFDDVMSEHDLSEEDLDEFNEALNATSKKVNQEINNIKQ
jgi:hypothetical protein